MWVRPILLPVKIKKSVANIYEMFGKSNRITN